VCCPGFGRSGEVDASDFQVRKELIALVKAGTHSLHIKSAAELIREAADAQIAIATAVASGTFKVTAPAFKELQRAGSVDIIATALQQATV
jgi:hypothetical protein